MNDVFKCCDCSEIFYWGFENAQDEPDFCPFCASICGFECIDRDEV